MRPGRSRDPCGTAFWSRLGVSINSGLLPCFSELRINRLSGTEAGGRFVVTRVENRDPAVLAYLRGLGLVPGRALRVREVRALDGVVTAEDEDGVSHALGAPLARSILVRHRA